MQDFQPIPGLSGRISAGSDTSTTRHLRPYLITTTHQQQQQQHQPIKCPRCESTNTKFCYYNNYNLSQPRHFCKACRRYWTKGGVLRNVPVGGGCRKNSKRSSSKPKPDKPPSLPFPASGSGSSSDSSSNPLPNPNPNPNPDPIPEPQPPQPQPQIFAENFIDGGFNFAADPGLLPDPEQGKGLNGLDWGNGSDSGSLFDMTSSVDPAAYWNQSHWGDTDPSLYLS